MASTGRISSAVRVLVIRSTDQYPFQGGPHLPPEEIACRSARELVLLKADQEDNPANAADQHAGACRDAGGLDGQELLAPGHNCGQDWQP
jgi:hypothetical protein